MWRARDSDAFARRLFSPRHRATRFRGRVRFLWVFLHRTKSESSVCILRAHKFYARMRWHARDPPRVALFLKIARRFRWRRYAYRFWWRTFFMTTYAAAIQKSQIPNTAKIFVPSECETP